jgi:hypothetical protein
MTASQVYQARQATQLLGGVQRAHRHRERVDRRVLARVLRQERRIRRELIKRFEGNGGTP